MTIVIPAGQKNADHATRAAQIASLAATPASAPHASQSAQLLYQTRREHVLALIDRGAIQASAVLSSVSYTTSGAAAAILAQITALKASIASLAVSNPQIATAKAADLEALQRQCCAELLSSGQMDPAAVISTLTFSGAN